MKKKNSILILSICSLVLVFGLLYILLSSTAVDNNKPDSTNSEDPRQTPPGSSVGTGTPQLQEPEIIPTVQNVTVSKAGKWGNTPGNIVNGGPFAAAGDYLYFSLPIRWKNTSSIFARSMRDGVTGLTLISQNSASFINVSDEWIYFVGPSRSLCRVGINGKEISYIQKGPIFLPIIYDGYIYYIYNLNIMKLPLINGSTPQKLASDAVNFTLTQDGEKIIYQANDFGIDSTFYEISTAGNSSPKKFQFPYHGFTGQIYSYKNYVYLPVMMQSDNYNGAGVSLNILRADTSMENGDPRIYIHTNSHTSAVNIDGKYLYYAMDNGNYISVMRMNLENESVEKFDTDIGISDFNTFYVLDGKIYLWFYKTKDTGLYIYDTNTKTAISNVLPN